MMNEMNELNESNEMTNKGANHMKKMKQLLKNQKGMTLIELLAVIVILAIVAAIAVPAIGNLIENSRVGAIKADAQNAISSAQLYFQENPEEDSVLIPDLVSEGFLEEQGSLDDTTEITKGDSSSTPATKTSIDGFGSTGDIKVTFTSATNGNINDYKNSERTATTEISVDTNASE